MILKRKLLAVAAACGGLALVAAQSPLRFADVAPGQWEITGHPDVKVPVRQCVADVAALAQFEHRKERCQRSLVSESGTSRVIEYSCPGGGFGRAKMTLITPRSLRVEAQGISGGLPFGYVLQARRTGDCPKN